MTKIRTVLTPTALAMALVFTACSNDDDSITKPTKQGTKASKPIEKVPTPTSAFPKVAVISEPPEEKPKQLKEAFEVPATKEPESKTQPAEKEEALPKPVEVKSETPKVEVKDEAPKRMPVAGAEFQHSFTASNGERRTVDIDADKLIVAKTPDGKTTLALTVAFAKQFDIYDPAKMARLSASQRRLIENAGSNMSTSGTDVALMVNHVMKAHGVPKDAMRDAYNACKSYFPELSR